jgi:hypothetical protein
VAFSQVRLGPGCTLRLYSEPRPRNGWVANVVIRIWDLASVASLEKRVERNAVRLFGRKVRTEDGTMMRRSENDREKDGR